MLSRQQRKIIEAAAEIRQDRPTHEDMAYMARQLVQVTLPHTNPGAVPEWCRTNGNLTLSIRSGWMTDPKSGERRPIGYPYGTIPRLLLFWITTESLRTKDRRIELGHSLHDFMGQLGLNPGNGGSGAKRSDARRLRDQMDRLFNATISFESRVDNGGMLGDARLNMVVASKTMLWWSPRDPDQKTLWGSWIELGGDFYDAITAAPVPVDLRALRALKRSPLALDLYAWLTYTAYQANKSGKARSVSWDRLRRQLGTEYGRTTDFQQKASATLRKIRALYPALSLSPTRGGIRVEPESLPAITPRAAIPQIR